MKNRKIIKTLTVSIWLMSMVVVIYDAISYNLVLIICLIPFIIGAKLSVDFLNKIDNA